jgi:hypothetical protein
LNDIWPSKAPGGALGRKLTENWRSRIERLYSLIEHQAGIELTLAGSAAPVLLVKVKVVALEFEPLGRLRLGGAILTGKTTPAAIFMVPRIFLGFPLFTTWIVCKSVPAAP